MSGRWSILALLFVVRTTMAIQFQSIAALAPLIQGQYGIGLADLGLTIGLYLAPGIVLALPGGEIGRRFGDKAVVVAGLGLMLCGGLLMAFASSWGLLLAGRLMAGIGGVLLNVLMSKMVTDWFAGREIATAMAIFVNSWPFGIALALLILPWIGTGFGLAAALLFVSALLAAGLIALAALYRTPASEALSPAASAWPSGPVLNAIVLAGIMWGLYNAAIAMVFAFGPTMLTERGWSLAAASSTTSIVLWLAVVAVPLAGFISDRSGRPQAVLLFGWTTFCVLLVVASRTEAVIAAFVALGLVSGLAAGPIMSLAARVLAPETRAVGMGIYYMLFYVLTVLAPWVAGALANAAGTARITFDFGAVLLLFCCAALWAFRGTVARAG